MTMTRAHRWIMLDRRRNFFGLKEKGLSRPRTAWLKVLFWKNLVVNMQLLHGKRRVVTSSEVILQPGQYTKRDEAGYIRRIDNPENLPEVWRRSETRTSWVQIGAAAC